MDRDLILTQVIAKLQDKNIRELIKTAFYECNSNWSDISGFLGIEDMEENITIQFKLGSEKYYHLQKDEGFTGYVYHTGKPAIFTTKDIKHLKETEHQAKKGAIAMEMVSVIKYTDENYKDHIIGVLLLDKHIGVPFDETDLINLNNICNNISDIISNKNPWDLRGWWKNYESKCLQKYKNELKQGLINTFKASNHSISNIIIHDVLKNSTTNPKVLNIENGTLKIENIDHDVLNYGTHKVAREKYIQSMIGVPFPINGAVKGIVTVSKNKEKVDDKEELQEIVNKISNSVESIKYPLLSEAFHDEHIGTKVFSILRIIENSEFSLNRKLSEICRSFAKINSSIITIYFDEKYDEKLESFNNIILTNSHDLETFFQDGYKSTRPRYWVETIDGLKILKCKIYYGNKLIGGLLAKSADVPNDISSKIDAQWDGPILEGLSSLAGKAISNFIKEFHLKECLKNFRNISIQEILEKALLILEANFICIYDCNKNSISKFCFSSDVDQNKIIPPLSKILDSLNFYDREAINLNWKENSEINEDLFRSIIFHRIANTSEYLIGGLLKLKSFKRNFDKSDEFRINILASIVFPN